MLYVKFFTNLKMIIFIKSCSLEVNNDYLKVRLNYITNDMIQEIVFIKRDLIVFIRFSSN